jgi:putative glutamine amidotransferase
MLQQSSHKSQEQGIRKPVVLMSMGAQERNGHDYQVMTVKYIRPLVDHARCVPLLAPTCFGSQDIEQYLSMVDGVYLTGAGSNIDPALYGQENLTPEKQQDKDRDHFDLPLIHAALKMGLPIFAICRGMQEINVAMGGDLHQKLYAVPTKNDHREDSEESVDQQYADVHKVRFEKDSWIAKIIGQEEIAVNSLHGQAIKTPGRGVRIIGRAEDTAIEAIDLPDYPQFTLGVQWHPEWKAAQNPHSVKMFEAFGAACRLRVQQVSQ